MKNMGSEEGGKREGKGDGKGEGGRRGRVPKGMEGQEHCLMISEGTGG